MTPPSIPNPAPATPGGTDPADDPVGLYRALLRIRRAEEKIVELYPQQQMRCPTHLSIGQEAAAVGVCRALRPDDIAYSTHRCHAHYLAKGGDLRAMFAELYGRRTGCARGKGGSMHLVDPDAGFYGASAIVGGTIPLAVGSALSFQLDGLDRVAVAFFGDAAVEGGPFHESLNFAALRKLAVLFACENNLYATCTPLSKRQPAVAIEGRAAAYGMAGVAVDGADALAVRRAARDAVERARRGEGPTLLVSTVYRWREHVGPNFDTALGYRTQDELDAWTRRCPLERLRGTLRERGVPGAALEAIETEVRAEIDDAVRFAQASPPPEPGDLAEGVY